ncbi:MAG: molybdate ABC transporter substrate-binding protein [Clostridia bacterium]|nr:molybdate ABC transporter substrate-binding protein [Clostridia bacterium]
MNKKVVWLVVLCMMLSMALLVGCAPNNENPANDEPEVTALPAQTITVAAAASLQEPLAEAIALYNQAQPNVTVDASYGSSGALLEQIQNGAPVDIFLSASKKYMTKADEAGLLAADTAFDWLTNSLVVATSAQSDLTLASLEDVVALNNIALGTPESVPAGKYAKEALTNAGLWEQAEAKAVYAKDVKSVASYVESGSADVGFIYASDTVGREGIKTQFTVDSSLHSPIVYPVGIIGTTQVMEAAKSFTDFLKTDDAKAIFANYGFGAAE